MGQLRLLLRGTFLVDAQGYNRVAGLPFTTAELEEAIISCIESTTPGNGSGNGAVT